jgi:hypothetical protein
MNHAVPANGHCLESMVSVPDTHEGAGYFPAAYLEGFLRFLRRHRRHIQLWTYDELPWGDNYDPETMYEKEKEAWSSLVKTSRTWRKKIHLVLQHDVDSVPEQSMAFARLEKVLGLRTNIMIFNRRIHRTVLEEHGIVQATPYPIDYDLLRRLACRGFTVGYHTNAYEQAGFDNKQALEVFQQDLADLRERLGKVSSFSPHGGVRGPNGKNNNSLDIDEAFQRKSGCRWVHNTRGPRFSGRFSDGGLNKREDMDTLDLFRFVQTWESGRRYRILIHPQYYGVPKGSGLVLSKLPRLMECPWYNTVWSAYAFESEEPLRRRALADRMHFHDPFWGRLRFHKKSRRFITC